MITVRTNFNKNWGGIFKHDVLSIQPIEKRKVPQDNHSSSSRYLTLYVIEDKIPKNQHYQSSLKFTTKPIF